jgi:integrase
MASVHRDKRIKGGVWYCSYLRRDGKRVWRSTGSKSKSRAKVICEAMQAAESEAARGELSTQRVSALLNETLHRLGAAGLERPTAESYLNNWLANKKVGSALRRHYRFAIKGFLSYLSQAHPALRVLLEQVTERDVARFLAGLKAEGRSASTLNRIRKNLATPFERARALGYIRFNPVAIVEPEKEDHLARAIFSAQDVTRLVKAAGGSDWEGLTLLGYGSGLRLQDAANLHWGDVDPELAVIHFRQRKTGRLTIIGLHADFADWLLRQSASDDPGAFLFPTLAGRDSGGRRGLSNEFAALMERAGLADQKIRVRRAARGKSLRARSFHSFRHGAASEVFNSAVVKEVARRVTAHSGEALSRYLHADLESIRAATALIPRLPK